jgi:hypothetical protein
MLRKKIAIFGLTLNHSLTKKRKNMKKVLLTAALGCAMLTPSFAQGINEVTGGLPFQVNDYYELLPNGAVPPDPITVVFTTPGEMAAGLPIPPANFSVVASRSWTVTYQATDFARLAGPESGIDEFIEPELIFNIYTESGDGLVNNLYSSGAPMAVTNSEQELVKGWGGDGRPYTIKGTITPGNVFGTHNLEGVYKTDVHQILSLD